MHSNKPFDDHERCCKVLGVNQHATQQDIRNAYKKLSLKYHPDKSLADAQMQTKLNDAYAYLTNPDNSGPKKASNLNEQVTEYEEKIRTWKIPSAQSNETYFVKADDQLSQTSSNEIDVEHLTNDLNRRYIPESNLLDPTKHKSRQTIYDGIFISYTLLLIALNITLLLYGTNTLQPDFIKNTDLNIRTAFLIASISWVTVPLYLLFLRNFHLPSQENEKQPLILSDNGRSKSIFARFYTQSNKKTIIASSSVIFFLAGLVSIALGYEIEPIYSFFSQRINFLSGSTASAIETLLGGFSSAFALTVFTFSAFLSFKKPFCCIHTHPTRRVASIEPILIHSDESPSCFHSLLQTFKSCCCLAKKMDVSEIPPSYRDSNSSFFNQNENRDHHSPSDLTI